MKQENSLKVVKQGRLPIPIDVPVDIPSTCIQCIYIYKYTKELKCSTRVGTLAHQ